MKLDKNELIDAIFLIGTICFLFCTILSVLSPDVFVTILLASLVGMFWFIGPDEE